MKELIANALAPNNLVNIVILYLPQVELEKVEWLIDWKELYAISAIFQSCNGG